MRRSSFAYTLIAAVLAAGAIGLPANARTEVPDGYRVTARDTLAKGLQHISLRARGHDLAVNVATFGLNAPVELRAVPSYGRIAGDGARLERTSAICARVDCLVAVNGDFYREQLPVGAVAAGGVLLRSPNRKHHQVYVTQDGALGAGQLKWKGRLVATDLSKLRLDGLNRDRDRDDLVMYTAAYGKRTGTNNHGVEMVLRGVAPRTGVLPIGATGVMEVVDYRHGKGDTKIPRRGAVLSAHGGAARELGALWERIRAGDAGRELLVRIETTPAIDTAIGGTPVLLKDGEGWFANVDNVFTRARHPRTLVGWNQKGRVWLVTVDGRQPGYSAGMSLMEAADLMRSLGATDAINLDGGGSTTFVVGGEVQNRPSDRLLRSGSSSRIVATVGAGVSARNIERPVANALAIVPRGAPMAPLGPLDLSGAIPKPETLSLPVPSDGDPGSIPDSDLPAILAAIPEPPVPTRGAPMAGAIIVHALVGVALALRARMLLRPNRA